MMVIIFSHLVRTDGGSARVLGWDQETLLIYLLMKIAGEEKNGGRERDGAWVKVRGWAQVEGHRGEKQASWTIKVISNDGRVAPKTMWARTKNKPAQLPNFSQDWPCCFVKPAVGDDLSVKVTFIRKIWFSSFLGLPSKNERGTCFWHLPTLTTMSKLSWSLNKWTPTFLGLGGALGFATEMEGWNKL